MWHLQNGVESVVLGRRLSEEEMTGGGGWGRPESPEENDKNRQTEHPPKPGGFLPPFQTLKCMTLSGCSWKLFQTYLSMLAQSSQLLTAPSFPQARGCSSVF